MKNIAVILTCHNRRKKTISCLSRLFKITRPSFLAIDVYLTDDGSTDGTYEEVARNFPQVKILCGDGSLFWTGGMNLAWNEAIRHRNYDGYLWLNDDTIMLENVWEELVDADEYSKTFFGKGGIYIGSTTNLDKTHITYGGWFYSSKIKNRLQIIKPNGTFLNCEIGNGNITYVSSNVVAQLGTLHSEYIHASDFDYTYWAYKKKFPVFILREYVGLCDNDHRSHKEILLKLNFKQRVRYLYSPTGLQFKGALLYQRRFFWYRIPYLYISYWLKVLFPRLMR